MLSLRNPASAFHDHQPIDCSKTSLMQGLIFRRESCRL
jgi:hypothetical protein